MTPPTDEPMATTPETDLPPSPTPEEAGTTTAGPGADPAGASGSASTPDGEGTSELAAVRAELGVHKDKLLRLYAEFENYKKRAAKDRLEAEHRGMAQVIRGLLEGLDDLSRFAHVDPAATDADTMHKGMVMTEQKFLKTLAGHGLEVVDPTGAKFDPAVAEAISTVPAANADEDHVVEKTWQVGYVLNGQLLRPARVVVKQWLG